MQQIVDTAATAIGVVAADQAATAQAQSALNSCQSQLAADAAAAHTDIGNAVAALTAADAALPLPPAS